MVALAWTAAGLWLLFAWIEGKAPARFLIFLAFTPFLAVGLVGHPINDPWSQADILPFLAALGLSWLASGIPIYLRRLG